MSRRLAGAGLARRLIQKPTGTVAWSPSQVPAADRVGWWRADLGVTLSGSRVANWEDQWNSEDFVQAIGASQPLFEAAGLAGQPSLANDDSARKMLCTLNTVIPAGSRAYMVVWGQVTAVGTAFLFTLQDPGGANVLLNIAQDASNWQAWRQETAAVFENLSSQARDTSVHRFEIGYTAGGTATRVIDSTSVNSIRTGTPGSNMTQARIFARYDGVNGLRARIGEVMILKNEPTYKAEIRAYGLARYGV